LLQKLGEGFSVLQENIHGFTTPITSKYKVYPSNVFNLWIHKKIFLYFIPFVQWDKPFLKYQTYPILNRSVFKNILILTRNL